MALLKNINNNSFYRNGPKNPEVRSSEKNIKKGIKYEEIDIDNIEFDPQNTDFNKNDTDDDIAAFAELIKRDGGIRNPPTVRDLGNNRYLMRSGEKRCKAAKLLGYKTLYCEIREKLNPDDPEYDDKLFEDQLIFVGDNALQRHYDNEQKFAMFLKLTQLGEKASDQSMMKFFDWSRNQYNKARTLIKNSKQSDLEKFMTGELSHADLENIVQLQKEENRRQARINEQVKLYSRSKEDNSVRYYIDRDNDELYSVSEKKNKRTVMFGIKHKNYKNNRPAEWLVNNECPLAENINEAQTFLDKLALINGFEECSVEEYISLLNMSYDNSDNKSNNTASINDNAPKKSDKKLVFPPIKKPDTSLDDELEDDDNNEHPDVTLNTKNDIDVKSKNTTNDRPRDNIEEIKNTTNGNEQTKDTNKQKQEERKTSQLSIDEIQNTYALNCLFEGKVIGSDETISGSLLKNSDNSKCFIIPQNSKIRIKNSKKTNDYVIVIAKAKEVEPSSIKKK